MAVQRLARAIAITLAAVLAAGLAPRALADVPAGDGEEGEARTASPDEGAGSDEEPDPLKDALHGRWGRPLGQLAERDSAVGAHAQPFVFRWPLDSIDVTSAFGMRPHPIDKVVKMHKGVDLHGVIGERVLAVGPGRVTRAGFRDKLGRYVAIAHPGGFVSIYGHLSDVLVFPGMRVARGAPIGLIGSSGHSTGPHLHFTLYANDQLVDPLRRIGRASNLPEDTTLP